MKKGVLSGIRTTVGNYLDAAKDILELQDDPNAIKHANTREELPAANGRALSVFGRGNTDYLAMNTSLRLFFHHKHEYI